jgi:hypothetical protein
MWRHALISFPHPLLKRGLVILDTPGLNALGNEPELTINMLPAAQAVLFVLAADTGVTRSDLDMWEHHVHRNNSSSQHNKHSGRRPEQDRHPVGRSQGSTTPSTPASTVSAARSRNC